MPDDHRDQDRALERADGRHTVPLRPTASLDLSHLSEAQRDALLADYAKGRIDIARKAEELGVEVRALDETLTTLSATTKEMAETDNAVTISHTQTTSVGRTEIMMGNTDHAKRGRLTKSQTGERDWTPYYVGGVLVAVVIVVLAVVGG